MERPERNTKQKQIVYDALLSLDHPTATEVYFRVHENYPTVSRGTVFRVLGGFAETGRVRRLCLTDSDVRFDPTLAPHAHARCGTCGRVFDVPVPLYREVLDSARTEFFSPDGLELEFFGQCGFCRGKEKTN